MTDSDSIQVTYRKRTFIISKCHHEAGAFTDSCLSCAPNWQFSCVELRETGEPPFERIGRFKPSLITNAKVMALPEVLAFTGKK